MAKQILTNAKIWLDQYDLSGNMNSVAYRAQADAVEVTNFGSSGFKNREPGLTYGEISGAGFWEATGLTTDADPALFSLIAAGGKVLTVSAPGGAEGVTAHFMQALEGSYNPGGAIGAAFKFDVSAMSTGPLVRGLVGLNRSAASGTNVTGAILTLGATGVKQRVYVPLHVFVAAGTTPSLTVALYSAATVGFSSPTLRATLTAMTAPGAQLLSIAGPFTDQYWRLQFSTTGTGPAFTFAAAVGID